MLLALVVTVFPACDRFAEALKVIGEFNPVVVKFAPIDKFPAETVIGPTILISLVKLTLFEPPLIVRFVIVFETFAEKLVLEEILPLIAANS